MDSIHRGSDFLDDEDDEESQDFSASVLAASTTEEDIEIERSGRPGKDAGPSLAESVFKLSLKTCDPCKEEDDRSAKKAVCFCVDCEEYLCDSCEKAHKKIGPSRNHIVYKNLCDPCRFEDKYKYVCGDWYCTDCNEFLCMECQVMHKKIKISRKHNVIRVELQVDQQVKTAREETLAKRNNNRTGDRDSKSSSRSSKVDPQKESMTRNVRGSDKKTTKLISTSKFHPAVKPLSECYARFVTQFDASVPGDDETPKITGATFLPDGRLLLADMQNRKLKLFGKDFNYLTEYKCPYRCFDVTVVDKSRVAATLFDDILTFEIEEKLKCISSVDFDDIGCTYGIACINSSKFVVSDPHSKALYLISDTGTIYSTIDKDKTGKPLFSDQQYVATDKNKSRLFVSDFDNDSVCCLSLNDSFTLDFTYKHDQLAAPYGVAVDHEDNVYVCGFASDNIHQLSKHGEHKQILLSKENVRDPQTIAFSPSGRTFIVGFENNKIVKVFNME